MGLRIERDLENVIGKDNIARLGAEKKRKRHEAFPDGNDLEEIK